MKVDEVLNDIERQLKGSDTVVLTREQAEVILKIPAMVKRGVDEGIAEFIKELKRRGMVKDAKT